MGGRTEIWVDGVPVYNKSSFLTRSSIAFDLIPGKRASLLWNRTSDMKMHCDVFVDGRATRLSPLPESQTTKAHKQRTEQWMGGAIFLGAAILSIWTNYSSLRKDATYYPKALGMVPVLIVLAIMSFLHPHVNFSPKSRKWQILYAVAGVAIAAFGFTVFTPWFLATFSN